VQLVVFIKPVHHPRGRLKDRSAPLGRSAPRADQDVPTIAILNQLLDDLFNRLFTV
jgi:hypothetical protein